MVMFTNGRQSDLAPDHYLWSWHPGQRGSQSDGDADDGCQRRPGDMLTPGLFFARRAEKIANEQFDSEMRYSRTLMLVNQAPNFGEERP